jgi:hypothetical protein
MDLISVVIVLIVIGVLLWLVNAYIPMQPPFKNIINAVVVIAAVLWLLGILLGMARIPNFFPPR